MIRRLIGATSVAVLLASAASVMAEGPMSPTRWSSPGVAKIVLPPVTTQDASARPASPPADQAGAAKPAAEPAAVAEIPPPAPATTVEPPAPVAESKELSPPDTLIPATSLAAEHKDDKAEPKTAQQQKKPRVARAVPRPHYRTYATRYAGWAYYPPAYRSSTWTGASMPYSPGFGPAPYSSSGN